MSQRGRSLVEVVALSLAQARLPVDAPEVSAPGGYASHRYRAGLRSWRRRVVARFALLLAPVCVVAFVVGFVNGDPSSFTAGMVFGAIVALVMMAADSPPHYVERWGIGADAERRTARALRALERRGWSVVHDVPTHRGNLDHVVVGPGGVFLLDTKAPSGRVTVDRDGIRVRHRHDDEAGYALDRLPARMRGAAVGLSRQLGRATGERLWVQAVIVFDHGFEQGETEGDRVVFLERRELVDWLAGRPQRLDADAQRRVHDAIRRLPAEAPALQLAA